ncbi:helix-turn-helix domain-containing protein [Paenibacillus sp. HWE-109]|uniref:helix-turn-helix domain-containing protein n=1 Tax=Paenibacillus sp. HWE-109 TaxID=1306526 RepID=UPI001EDF9A37|nr:helix-turn-helix domain-containing protein [Paenibacillus sp. HWE-109]UKS26585.1 helix-turn-helix domain-containing protein [Paenibacillus sp. HWE-109]
MSIFSHKRSLFRNILTSFIILILIFSCFHLLIFGLLKSHLRSEMIQQNRLTLQKVAERYQFQLDRVKEVLFKTYTDKNMIAFNSQVSLKKDTDTLNTRPLIENIQSVVSDSELYLDNLIVLFRSTNLTMNKWGPSAAEGLFAAYASTSYPPAFWQAQFARGENYVLHPAARFGGLSTDSTSSKTLIPYSIKPALADNMLVALIDADRLRDAILKEHPALHLAILGPDNTPIYQTDEELQELPEALLAGKTENKKYLAQNGIYYIDYPIDGGLHFIMKVTSPDLAAKILRLDNLMVILLGLSILLALVASFFFSKRIHKPVRELLKEKGEMKQELQEQQSLLTNYHYMNKLKNINHEMKDWSSMMGKEIELKKTEETFTVVLYELRYRSAAFVEAPMSKEHISLAIGEHLKPLIETSFPASHTFQMEHHQFLSVFPGTERERMLTVLDTLKMALDRDLRYALVTIAVSSAFEHSVQFGHAYRQVKEMAMQARLLEETQIISEFRADRSAFTLTLAQEQDLIAALKSGKELDTLNLILPWLEELAQKEASVDMFRLLTLAVTDKAKKILEHYKVQPDIAWQLKPIMLQLEECCTLEEYTITFQTYFRTVTQLIRDKKEISDPIIDHVLAVVQEHYAEDLSLDVLADQLNLSTSYLSTYIKEKTGANFMEHLHDRRVRNAQHLLHQTDLNIQEIGVQVGYRNISSFNRMFKNRTGSSPGEYRRTSMLNRTS